MNPYSYPRIFRFSQPDPYLLEAVGNGSWVNPYMRTGNPRILCPLVKTCNTRATAHDTAGNSIPHVNAWYVYLCLPGF